MRRAQAFEIRASGFAVLISHDSCGGCGQTTPVTSILLTEFETELAGYSMPITGAALLMDIESINPGAYHEWERRAPWLTHRHRTLGLSPLVANACVHCGHASVESERRHGALGPSAEVFSDRILYSRVDAPLRAYARFDSAAWMDRLVERQASRPHARSIEESRSHRVAA